MSWQNEVREEIEFYSPNGNVYFANWRQDSRTREKKLGIFNIPKFDGDIVQDMGVKSTIYPLTIYFEGPFHHFLANQFFEALKEPGQWEVVHPVQGSLILQPVRFVENIDTINENITEFNTEWIQPANVQRLISPDELASSILSTVEVLIEDAATMLLQLRADAFALVNSTISAFDTVGGLMDNTLQELTATDAILFESSENHKFNLQKFIAILIGFGIAYLSL